MKERILVTLAPRVAREISTIAKREQTPRASVAARMLEFVVDDLQDDDLTRDEERALAKIVKERDKPDAVWLSEKEANELFLKLHKR